MKYLNLQTCVAILNSDIAHALFGPVAAALEPLFWGHVTLPPTPVLALLSLSPSLFWCLVGVAAFL